MLYFTKLNNLAPWHSTQGKYIMLLKESFLVSLSSPATQHLNTPSIRTVQATVHSTET